MTKKTFWQPKRLALAITALLLCSAGALAGIQDTRAASQTVTIQNFAFNPPSLTVNVGDTVTWTNQDTATHTATSDTGAFDTGSITNGSSKSVTFTAAGTFAYHCSFHPTMHGTIVVQQAGPTATQPAPTATTGISPPPPPPPPPGPATATPTATSAPTATATAAPILTLSAKLSPKSVRPGKKVKLQVLTLAGAKLAITISYKGVKNVTRHGTAKTDGVYTRTFTISKSGKRGTLTFKIKATFAGQSLTKSVKGNIT